MVLQLFGTMFRPWQLTTVSRGKKNIEAPVPDQQPRPKFVQNYMQCQWRDENMALLEFLRKSNDQGAIAGWLTQIWKVQGQPNTIETFANAYSMNGEKVVAYAMGSRLRDKFYGQWLVLHVPFRDPTELLQIPNLANVPTTDKYLAACLASQHPVAVATWNNQAMQEEEMLAEGVGQTSRKQILDHVSTHGHLIRQYLSGALAKPLLEDKPEKAVLRR